MYVNLMVMQIKIITYNMLLYYKDIYIYICHHLFDNFSNILEDNILATNNLLDYLVSVCTSLCIQTINL